MIISWDHRLMAHRLVIPPMLITKQPKIIYISFVGPGIDSPGFVRTPFDSEHSKKFFNLRGFRVRVWFGGEVFPEVIHMPHV